MQPIVNGLEEQYNQDMKFIYLNANTDGVFIYGELGLRGHPAYVIFLPDGTETFRTLGYQDEAILINGIEETLQNVDTSPTHSN